MEIYIEYAIADNFCVAFTTLYLTALSARQRFYRIRAVILSLLHTAVALGIVYLPDTAVVLAKIALMLTVTVFSQKKFTAKNYLRTAGFYLLYNFLFAGIFVLLPWSGGSLRSYFVPTDYTPAIVAAICLACVIVAKRLFAYYVKLKREKLYVWRVSLFVKGREFCCEGYFDSGNRLLYKGCIPVVMCSQSFAERLKKECDLNFDQKIKVKTVTGERTIDGFFADSISIDDGHGVRNNDAVVIGVGNKDYNGYPLLLNCDL